MIKTKIVMDFCQDLPSGLVSHSTTSMEQTIESSVYLFGSDVMWCGVGVVWCGAVWLTQVVRMRNDLPSASFAPES